MSDRPDCYPARGSLPLLDVLTSPVPRGVFDSPIDGRHVLCLHLGSPVPVTYRVNRSERGGVRLHGQFCVVPAGSSTRWTLSAPATSLLLRMPATLVPETAQAMGLNTELAPAIHLRDAQIERIGWLMQAEAHDGHPGGRLFADGLATALAARLIALQSHQQPRGAPGSRTLPAWRLRRVVDYLEANLANELGLAELAAVAGYSVSHFKTLFRNSTGLSVHRFVLERRVERARAALGEGRSSITEIALETGFSHASHLARAMRRILGTSPSQLRS